MPTRLFILAASAAAMIGCESSSAPTVRERQDAALKDPMNYGPALPSAKSAAAPANVRDDSLKGDLDRFWGR